MKANYDIIGIGDCTLDTFVILEEANVHCNLNHEDCQLCMSFANKIPYQSMVQLSAGNSNNVSVGMSRLGFKSAFYGTVGADEHGRIILNALKKDKVNTSMMSIQKKFPTNFHIVLSFKGERTILIKHQPYAYELPPNLARTNWIYFSSVGESGLSLHPKLVKFLQANAHIKMAFNPGTFQLRLGMEKLMPLMRRTEILFVNKEEAELLAGRNGGSMEKLARVLHKHGPKIVVITDGLNGSYCFDRGNFYYIGIYPHRPIEATGAGDAFATGFTAAMMRGLGADEAMRWGARNGASVATQIGPQAGLVTKKEMLNSLGAHKQFRAQLMNAEKAAMKERIKAGAAQGRRGR